MISRVHQLAEAESQPRIADNFKFEWRLEGEGINSVHGDNKDKNGTNILL